MRIVKLSVSNYMGIKAVELVPDPDGSLVIVAGKNGQGKTSILNAIWAALSGAEAGKGISAPIRHGEDKARVSLDLGDMVVTRTWNESGTQLKVTNADGNKFQGPQAILNSLVGRLSFDPFAYSQQDDKSQLADLLALVDLPFDPAEIAAKRARIYDDRTDIGRNIKSLAGQLDGLPKIEGAPEEEISVSETFAELTIAQRAAGDHERLREAARAWDVNVARAREAFNAAQEALVAAEYQYERAVADLDELPDPEAERATIDQLTELISGAERTNAEVKQNRRRADIETAHAANLEIQANLTASIERLDKHKTDALAKVTMPVEGLGFGDTGVTYNGIPFRQCSAAERLRVSTAMAMALNPSVRVIRITDGSLLDTDNLAVIKEMATGNDFQVWVEIVGDTEDGFVIEDGALAGAE